MARFLTEKTTRLQLKRFFEDDRGQDIVEYTLLLAFLAFTVAGLASGLGASISGVTSLSNQQITAASTAVS